MKREIIEKNLETYLNKGIDCASDNEIYDALLVMCKDLLEKAPVIEGERKLYYISAEFLIGKLLSNNLINLGLYDDICEILKAHGKDMGDIEELESEPSLGNGGLGRLAACFLDSIANLGLCGDGVGLNYHFGLFRQIFENHKQTAAPNPWIEEKSWLKRSAITFTVPFYGFSIQSALYDIAVPGIDKGINRLRLFDVDCLDETIVENGISFNKKDIIHNLTLFLYPDDSDEAGNLLRIYQQYFMVSNAAQLILHETKERGYSVHDLDKHVVVQINDTHPSMVIPELIRLLVGNEGFTMDEAIEVVSKTCAYTNHTILAEALEKWPIHYLEKVVPQLVPIIKELDKRVREKYDDSRVYIIDDTNRVHMAHMDIHYGFSINGVAALHTDILKQSELKPFYEIYPEKFNNKTNGITFRRWLLSCNHELAELITELIGDDYKKDASKLSGLMKYVDDDEVLCRLMEVKQHQKTMLKDYFKHTQNIEIDDHSVYDIQIKRLHEYKRQQMNMLYAIYKYKEIKAGRLPKTPVTMIFGAKAAPAYVIAQDIIHLILCMQELIEKDEEVKKYLKVVMVENYNVTKASKLIPACDISEQISLASKEASGTGNMKFMLNGAVTLGTEDGANVEIHEFVGDENIYIFGKSSDEVIKLYDEGTYSAREIYENDACIKDLVDFIVSDELKAIGDSENLERLHNELIVKDWFMTLLDVKEYIEVKEKMLSDYDDKKAWAKKALINIANAGFFSSDRTIEEYNKDIWKL